MFLSIRYLFRLLAADVLIAQGFLGIIENFGWRRVSIILQDENVFTAVSIWAVKGADDGI